MLIMGMWTISLTRLSAVSSDYAKVATVWVQPSVSLSFHSWPHHCCFLFCAAETGCFTGGQPRCYPSYPGVCVHTGKLIHTHTDSLTSTSSCDVAHLNFYSQITTLSIFLDYYYFLIHIMQPWHDVWVSKHSSAEFSFAAENTVMREALDQLWHLLAASLFTGHLEVHCSVITFNSRWEHSEWAC